MGDLTIFSILLCFQSGLQATMKTYAHASWHFPFERLEVFGMHSTYETFEMEKISFTIGLESRTTTYGFSLASMHEKWGYIEEDQLFVDALVDIRQIHFINSSNFLWERIVDEPPGQVLAIAPQIFADRRQSSSAHPER
jgi:hypothetical protein